MNQVPASNYIKRPNGRQSGDTLRFQSAGRHQFRDEDDVFPFGQCHLPVVVEADDVGMLKALQHFGLLTEPLPFTFVQLLLLFNQNKSINSSRSLHSPFF
jgi:hypothetical protein